MLIYDVETLEKMILKSHEDGRPSVFSIAFAKSSLHPSILPSPLALVFFHKTAESRWADVVGSELVRVAEAELEEVDGHEGQQHQT